MTEQVITEKIVLQSGLLVRGIRWEMMDLGKSTKKILNT